MSYRFLLRLITNLAIFLLTLCSLGIVLWVIDQFLLWDLLSDAWSNFIRALLVAGGIIAFMLVLMNLLLSFALVAESHAARAELPDYAISSNVRRRVSRAIVITLMSLALLIGGLQITNQIRARTADQAAEVAFDQTQTEMEASLQGVLNLFTPDMLEAIETNTLAEKGQLGNTTKLFDAIKTSFPHEMDVSIITPANQAPFKYKQMNRGNIVPAGEGKLQFSPTYYANFPSVRESEAIEQLFKGKLVPLTEPLPGKLINNTVPSIWGLLKREGRTIAIVYLQKGNIYNEYKPVEDRSSQFHHGGPTKLLTNS
jgi:hypothetical protein